PRQRSGLPHPRRLCGVGGLGRHLAATSRAPQPVGRRDHRASGAALVARLLWVPAFFALKVAVALGLLKLSASFLPVGGFSVFSQLMLFSALLNVLALCGAQN